MEMPNRDPQENELAEAILLIWLLLLDQDAVRLFASFMPLFDSHVRPILTQMYGQSRNSLAEQAGVVHRRVPSELNLGGQTVQIPGLNAKIDQFAGGLFDIFQANMDRREKAEANDEDPPAFRHDTIARTTTTEVQTAGEFDARAEIESRTGERLEAVWVAEPGMCELCEALDGTTRKWRTEWPQGPPRHPRCRCYLRWVSVVGSFVEKSPPAVEAVTS